jgi:hypothetical protein
MFNGSVGGQDHFECMDCVESGVPVEIGACHECASLETKSSQQVAYRALQRAGARGDVDAVLKLAATLPGKVIFNVARNAVQILSCSGSAVVGSLQIENKGQQLVAMALLTDRKVGISRLVGEQ